MRRQHQCVAWILILIVVAALVGCGNSTRLTAQDEAKVRQLVENGLSAWKKGESAKKWTTTGAAVRFVDNDWMNGDKLTDYQIVRVQSAGTGPPEAIVRLSLKPAKGPAVEREVQYTVSFGEDRQAVVSRDPLY